MCYRLLTLVRGGFNGIPTLFQDKLTAEEHLASAASSDLLYVLPPLVQAVG